MSMPLKPKLNNRPNISLILPSAFPASPPKISEEIGVEAAIAAVSHAEKGIWALLVIANKKIQPVTKKSPPPQKHGKLKIKRPREKRYPLHN